MSVEQPKGIPAWEDFAAFEDMGVLSSVCHMFEEAAEEGAGIEHFAGGESYLIKQLLKQHVESFNLLEQERPGLYQRTWMAKVINGLFVRLDVLVRIPQYLPDDLHGLLLDLHKVMIAAHEIYDPRSRAKLVADAAQKAASDAIPKKNKEIATLDRASEGINLAVHYELHGRWNGARPTAASVWKRMKKYTEDRPLRVGEFDVFVASGKLTSIYSATGKADGRPVGEASFPRAFARAKKSFAIAG